MRLAVPGSPPDTLAPGSGREPHADNVRRRAALSRARGTLQEFRMGRTISLLGVVVFAFGVVALSSLARRAQAAPAETPRDEPPRIPESPPRRAVFAFDAPFSVN